MHDTSTQVKDASQELLFFDKGTGHVGWGQKYGVSSFNGAPLKLGLASDFLAGWTPNAQPIPLVSKETSARLNDPKIFLRPSVHSGQGSSWLWRLVHFYVLDVFGSSGLSRKGIVELKLTALLLTIDCFFVIIALSFLFNALGLWMPLAFLLGIFCASVELVFQRSLITVDVKALSTLRAIAIMALNSAICLFLALTTALPVVVLVFNEPLQQYNHQRSVIDEARNRIIQLQIDDQQGVVNQRDRVTDQKPLERLRRWVSTIENAQLGVMVTEKGVENPFTFQDRRLTFLDKWLIVRTICQGKSSIWDGITNASRQFLENVIGLHVASVTEGKSIDLQLMYLGTIALTCFISFVPSLLKLLMSQELSRYYSIGFQLAAGNQEVFQTTGIREPSSHIEKSFQRIT